MLLHKEACLIDRISRRGVVLADIQSRRALRGERSARWIAESQVYRASSRNVAVVDDQNSKGLAALTRGKIENAVSRRVVFALFCRAVAGGKAHAGRTARIARGA